MTTSTSTHPPTFPNDEKFDGTNFLTFGQTITITTRLRGARGYLDGTITKPQTTDAPPGDPTAWTSTSPSAAEWDTRDAWVLALIMQNTKNAIGLGVKLDGTAAEAWKSLTGQYQVSSDLALINAQRELRNTTLLEGGDVLAHISLLRTKWAQANAVGAKIVDSDFRMILLSSLPPSWDSLVATLYDAGSSTDVITRITMHWTRLTRQTATLAPTTSVFQANAGRSPRNTLHCTNPNCDRDGHLITDCYWPGGGKAGQFPPGFGTRRRGESLSAPENQSTPRSSANMATVEVYALMANTYEPKDMDQPTHDDTTLISAFPPDISNHTSSQSKEGNTLIFADSGASHHCFINKADFTSYNEYPEHQEGRTTNGHARFKIYGCGTVNKVVLSGGLKTTLTFTDALYTPDLTNNLMSIGQLDTTGHQVAFGGGKATLMCGNGEVLAVGKKLKGMFVFETAPAPNLNNPLSADSAGSQRLSLDHPLGRSRQPPLPRIPKVLTRETPDSQPFRPPSVNLAQNPDVANYVDAPNTETRTDVGHNTQTSSTSRPLTTINNRVSIRTTNPHNTITNTSSYGPEPSTGPPPTLGHATLTRLECIRMNAAIAADSGTRFDKVRYAERFLGISDLLPELTAAGEGYWLYAADASVHKMLQDSFQVRNMGELKDIFGSKDLGELNETLGIRVEHEDTGMISLSQRRYLTRLLDHYGMLDCMPEPTPFPFGHNSTSQYSPTDFLSGPLYIFYSQVLSALIWAQVTTRPDLTQPLDILLSFRAAPTRHHLYLTLHLLAYIKGTLQFKLNFRPRTPTSLTPTCYVDAVHRQGLDGNTQGFISGNTIVMAGGPVSWALKRHRGTASIANAEYTALASASHQAERLFMFMNNFNFDQHFPAILYITSPSLPLAFDILGRPHAWRHSPRDRTYLRGDLILCLTIPQPENPVRFLTQQLSLTDQQLYIQSFQLDL